MARKKTKADELYNMRRRLTRAAERSIRKAQKATGAERERLEWQAEQHLKRAAATYSGSAVGKKVTDLEKKLGKEIEKPSRFDIEQIKRQAEKSKFRFGKKARREQSAREVLNSNVGSRIIGAFESEWRDDKANMLEIIMQRTGASDLMEVVEIIEEKVGASLYMEPGDTARYDEVVELIKQAFDLK